MKQPKPTMVKFYVATGANEFKTLSCFTDIYSKL